MRVAFHASRKRRMSSSVYGAAVHWSWFLRKIWTTEQPTSSPRSRARYTPPAMDMWAPRRSGIECPLHGLELALEPPDLSRQGPPPRRFPEQPVFHQRQKRAGHLFSAPAAGRVVPLVEPVEHPQEPEDDEAGGHVPEDPPPDAFVHDGLHALVIPVLLRGELAREARGQVGLLAEEDGQERAIGDDEAHVLPDDPAELVLRGQARAQHQAELPGESLDGFPGDGREHLVFGAEVRVERGLGHAEPPSDVVEGGGPIPALAKEVRRRAEDLVADGLPPGVHGSGVYLTGQPPA